MGSYVFRWPYPANDVHLTGIFDDWGKSVQMNKVGDHWEKEVDLPSADEKVLYKFVVDGEWIVDENAPKEGDGHWNINNVLYPDQITRKPADLSRTDSIPGAFPETPANELPAFGVQPIPASSGAGNPISLAPGATVPSDKGLTESSIESSVTTSKEDYEKGGSSTAVPESKAEDSTFSVNPLPASSGLGNPISVPAGSELPPLKEITSKSLESEVTTSKEDYEKGGNSAAVPESKVEDSTFAVNPLPASSGLGNPISVPAGSELPPLKEITSKSLESEVTTSKEDYEKGGSSSAVPEPKFEETTFSANPIPASSGIGNPIFLPAGAAIPDQKSITPHTLTSNVTTSKEDYDNAGSSTFPAAAVAAAGGVLGGAALGSAFAIDKNQKNIIPESSLPMGVEKKDVLGTGPFISSSGPGTTTADLASKVPLESNPIISSSATGITTADLASKVPLETNPVISSSATGTTTADLASKVPLEKAAFNIPTGLDESTSKLASELEVPLKSSPFVSSSATGATTADLASKVPLEDIPTIRSSGPGTTTAALASNVPLEAAGVPGIVKDSISSSHEAPEVAISSEAVKEKADLGKELLSKTQVSQATGESASAAAGQSSYYGLATSVPTTVEKSMEKAHASPEAAAETSAVAEKSKMEHELLSKIPSTDEAGEPAPTIAAATSPTAPTSTSTAVPTSTAATVAATSVTDGITANEPVPDTDTSSAARGTSAGAIAAGVAVGGAAAAGTASLVARHKDAEKEPPRVADSLKPDVTTEESPATATKVHAPDQSTTTAPQASGTEIPALADEPAVKMMNQNENVVPSTGPGAHDSQSSTTAAATGAATSAGVTAATGLSTAEGKDTTYPSVHDITTTAAPTTGAAGSTASKNIAAPTVEPTTTSSVPTTAPVATPEAVSKDTTTPIVHDTTTSSVPTTAPVATPEAVSKDTTTPIVHDTTTSSATTTDKEPTSTEVGTDATPTTAAHTKTTAPVDGSVATSTGPTAAALALTPAAGVPSLTSVATGPTKIADAKTDTGASAVTSGSTEPQAPSTPAKKIIQSSAVNSPASATTSTASKDKKKRHRLSAFIKKIFD